MENRTNKNKFQLNLKKPNNKKLKITFLFFYLPHLYFYYRKSAVFKEKFLMFLTDWKSDHEPFFKVSNSTHLKNQYSINFLRQRENYFHQNNFF